MKYILRLLLIITIIFTPNLSFSAEVNIKSSAAFNSDVVAHDDIDYNDEISDLAVAFNGWIYIVTASRHTSPSGAGFTYVVSKDSGVTWNDLGSSTGAHNNIDDIKILVTGNDTNSLRIYVAVLGNDIGNPYETGVVFALDGFGRPLSSPFVLNLTSFTSPVGGISMASDYLHPAIGTTEYSVAILYTIGGPFTDSLVCLLFTDTGSTNYNYYLVDTGFVNSPSIDYGFSQSNDGKYYVAFMGGNGIECCRNISSITSGFTPPLSISSLTGISSFSNPKIICQNSFANNDSSGLSVAVVVINGSGNNGLLEVMYNMQADISDFWNATSVDNSIGLGLSNEYDACYSEVNNQFFICGYDKINSRLFSRMEDFNFSHLNNWISISDQYNDSLIDTSLEPYPKVEALGNNIISSWCSLIPGTTSWHRARTLFDKESLSINTATPFILSKNLTFAYPIPADEYLRINVPTRFLVNSISIQLIDYKGEIMLNIPICSPDNLCLNTSAFSNGIYLLKIFSDVYLETQRIVICH